LNNGSYCSEPGMNRPIEVIGECEIHCEALRQPATKALEFQVTIRLFRSNDCDKAVGPSETLFVGSGQTREESLRRAQEQMHAWLQNQFLEKTDFR
jgi:hypothetical protein